MKTWFIASVCTLAVSWLSALTNDAGFTTFQYFSCTCLFGIFLKLKE